MVRWRGYTEVQPAAVTYSNNSLALVEQNEQTFPSELQLNAISIAHNSWLLHVAPCVQQTE